jgi:hypothetical protein
MAAILYVASLIVLVWIFWAGGAQAGGVSPGLPLLRRTIARRGARQREERG